MILLAALALDLCAGEPPNRWHPVAWVGRLLGRLFRLAPGRGRAALLAHGAVVVCGTAAAAAWAAGRIEPALAPLGLAGVLAQVWLLKCSFSLRGLFDAAKGVEGALTAGDLDRARSEVGLRLVSRPTAALGTAAVASAAVESVAENLTDSFVAPLLFYLLFGLPGAWAYRVVNTADAMVGYREGALEHLGKTAARLDDILNLVPARLAALALVLGAAVAGGNARRAAGAARRQHGLTASPNAGWTLAAMAGALGVLLEKPGAYRLGEGREPVSADIGRSVEVVAAAAALVVLAAVLAQWLCGEPG